MGRDSLAAQLNEAALCERASGDTASAAERVAESAAQPSAVPAPGRKLDELVISRLVEIMVLGDEEGLHEDAERALAALEGQPLPALLAALRSCQPHLRWHAARALGRIHQVAAADGLALALADADQGVRLTAAEALAGLGALAVPSILECLVGQPLVEATREALYYALCLLQPVNFQLDLAPLRDALQGPDAATAAPAAAFRLLQALDGRP